MGQSLEVSHGFVCSFVQFLGYRKSVPKVLRGSMNKQNVVGTQHRCPSHDNVLYTDKIFPIASISEKI